MSKTCDKTTCVVSKVAIPGSHLSSVYCVHNDNWQVHDGREKICLLFAVYPIKYINSLLCCCFIYFTVVCTFLWIASTVSFDELTVMRLSYFTQTTSTCQGKIIQYIITAKCKPFVNLWIYSLCRLRGVRNTRSRMFRNLWINLYQIMFRTFPSIRHALTYVTFSRTMSARLIMNSSLKKN